MTKCPYCGGKLKVTYLVEDNFPKSSCIECNRIVDVGNSLASEVIRFNALEDETEGGASTHRFYYFINKLIFDTFKIEPESIILAKYVDGAFQISIGNRVWMANTPEEAYMLLFKDILNGLKAGATGV